MKALSQKPIPEVGLEDILCLFRTGDLVGPFLCSNEDYHDAPGISKSGLDDVNQCPALFKYNRENPQERTESFEFGAAAHTAVLEPGRFADRYAIAPVELDRRGTNAWKAFEAANPGKTILKHKDGERLLRMSVAVQNHSRARGLCTGRVEVSFWWTDLKTGLLCKCRVDVLPGQGVAGDYKTAAGVMPARKWASDMYTYRYHVQAAWYLDGLWHALNQANRLDLISEMPTTFVFIAQEKDAPYLVKIWIVGPQSIALGRRTYERDLATIAECEKTGIWPGYPEAMQLIECPEYAWRDEE